MPGNDKLARVHQVAREGGKPISESATAMAEYGSDTAHPSGPDWPHHCDNPILGCSASKEVSLKAVGGVGPKDREFIAAASMNADLDNLFRADNPLNGTVYKRASTEGN